MFALREQHPEHVMFNYGRRIIKNTLAGLQADRALRLVYHIYRVPWHRR